MAALFRKIFKSRDDEQQLHIVTCLTHDSSSNSISRSDSSTLVSWKDNLTPKDEDRHSVKPVLSKIPLELLPNFYGGHDRSECVKLALVGNGGVGKTTLCITFVTMKTTPFLYTPRVFDGYSALYTIEGNPVSLGIFDVGPWNATEEEMDRLRPLAYPQTKVFVICFALNDRESFERVESKWYPEVSHFCPNTPVVLAGCKSDLRSDLRVTELANRKIISYEEALEMSRRINAVQYVECTAESVDRVWDVFAWAVHAAVSCPKAPRTSRRSRGSCFIS